MGTVTYLANSQVNGLLIIKAEALAIFSISLARDIHIEPEWIPRRDNEIADYLSRVVNYDDWSLSSDTLSSDIFQWVDKMWGPHTVDCFASY